MVTHKVNFMKVFCVLLKSGLYFLCSFFSPPHPRQHTPHTVWNNAACIAPSYLPDLDDKQAVAIFLLPKNEPNKPELNLFWARINVFGGSDLLEPTL